jgi:cell division protein FtsL
MSETRPKGTKSKRMVSRNVAIVLGIICIVLLASLVGVLTYYGSVIDEKNSTISSLNSQIAQLKNQLASDNSAIANLQTQLNNDNTTISNLTAQANEYNSTITNLQTQISKCNSSLTNLQIQINSLSPFDFILKDFSSFNQEFGNIPLTLSTGSPPVYNFSPPISVYKAATIALESDAWNKSSLTNSTITAELFYVTYVNNTPNNLFSIWNSTEVTKPPADYSPVQINDTTSYHYAWYIELNAPHTGPPNMLAYDYYCYWVDAATGEILPNKIVLSP